MCRDGEGERNILGIEYIQMLIDKIRVVKINMKISQDQPKNYADNNIRKREYEVGHRFFLKLSPRMGIILFGRHGKLSPRKIVFT